MTSIDRIPLEEKGLVSIQREALEYARIGLYGYRFDGTIEYMDRSTLKIIDADSIYPDPEMVVGRDIGEVFIYNYPIGALRGQVRLHGRVRSLETNIRTITGKVKWVTHDAFIALNPATGAEFIQVVIQDITERKLAEETVQQVYDEIETRARKRSPAEREQVSLLDEVLDNTLTEIQRIIPADAASIALIENGYGRVVRYHDQAGQSLPRTGFGQFFSLKDMPDLESLLRNHRPFLIKDSQIRALGWVGQPEDIPVRSYLGAPIYWAGQVIGLISLNSAASNFFNAVQAERLQVLADQAALAIHDARQYLRAQELATQEERQRLARDLHDAVSQTLWTASLIANALPMIWENDQEKARQSLIHLQRLTRGALAEMRSLLLELRPSTLEQAQLSDLIQQLAKAAMSRKEIDIQVTVLGEVPLQPNIKIGLYRLAQEALNNAEKHARATCVEIRLEFLPDRILLAIRDNGHGFDLGRDLRGLGLGIMRERAAAMGACLELNTAIGAGTEIQITLPASDAGDRKE